MSVVCGVHPCGAPVQVSRTKISFTPVAVFPLPAATNATYRGPELMAGCELTLPLRRELRSLGVAAQFGFDGPVTQNGRKLEILFPWPAWPAAAGELTPIEYVPGAVSKLAGMTANSCVLLTAFVARLVDWLPLFQVTVDWGDPVTKLEPST